MKKIKGILRAALPSLYMLCLELAILFLIGFGRTLLMMIMADKGGEAYTKIASYNIDGLYMFTFEVCSVLLFSTLYFKQYSKQAKAFVGQISVLSFPGIILLFCGAELITSCGLLSLSFIAPDMMEAYSEKMAATMGDMSAFYLVSALILAPVAEEFIFRGITLELSMRMTKRFIVANIIQAAFFGIVHLNLIQGVYAFLLGLILGFVRRRYDSLIASIIGHITFNIAGSILISVIFPDSLAGEKLYIIAVAAGSVIAVLAGLFIILKDKKSNSGIVDFDEMHTKVYALANVTDGPEATEA